MPDAFWVRIGVCICLLAAAAIAPLGCGHGDEPAAAKATPPAPELETLQAAVVAIRPAIWPDVIRSQGNLVADEVTVVGAKVAGRVKEVRVDLGDAVAAQEVLASLDQEEFRLQIELAQAQLMQSRAALGLKPTDPVESLNPENAPPVREAKAVLDEISTRIERTRQLRVRNAVTQDELDQAVAEQGVAEARYSSAMNGVREKIALIGVRGAELSVAQQRLADTVVQAPFAGIVQQRQVAPGTYLQVGDPVITLVRTSTLRFRGTVPERHAHRLALGQQVKLTIESVDQPQFAQITRISPTVEELSRSLMFEAELANEEGQLRTGLFAEAEVVVDPAAEALVVPQAAIVEFAGSEKVWKVVDGVAQEQVIETARRSDGSVEIADGLASGDLILLDGAAGKVARIEPISTSQAAQVSTEAAIPAGVAE